MILLLQFFALAAKKLQLNCIKKHLHKTAVKLKDCIVQLRDDANVWRKIAIISKSWETDSTTAPHSLTDRMRCLCTADTKENQNFKWWYNLFELLLWNWQYCSWQVWYVTSIKDRWKQVLIQWIQSVYEWITRQSFAFKCFIPWQLFYSVYKR